MIILKYNFVFYPFFCRKRILATGAGCLSKMPQPDSTVASEPSSRDSSGISCDTSSAMLSSLSAPGGPKKTTQSRCSLNNPVLVKSVRPDNETSCDSPSTYGLTNPTKKTSGNASELFFSPKKPETAAQAHIDLDIDPSDFYDDSFDIDDLSDSDIPQYFDEPLATSAPPQKPSTSSAAIKEGGASKPSWQNPTTPVSAAKASQICSPGEDPCHSDRNLSP